MQMLGEETILTKAAKAMYKSYPKTILIAEDHDDSRELLRVFLEGEGFNVIEAKNGAEAVRLARQECPDLGTNRREAAKLPHKVIF
jgi:PleD family two-component response regulator